MKYPYAVKANGKWYRPGQEVPEDKPIAKEETAIESANQGCNPLIEEVQEQTAKPETVEDAPKRRGRKPRLYRKERGQ